MRSSFALLALLPIFAFRSASAETIELTPAEAPLRGEWKLSGLTAAAPLHPLAPVVHAGPGASIEMRVPGAGAVLMAPAGFFDASGRRMEPEGGLTQPRLVVESGRIAKLENSWPGIDEVFALHPASVEHDLVIQRGALAWLPAGDVFIAWTLALPEGATLSLEPTGVITLRGVTGGVLAHVPAPVVGDARDAHLRAGIARLELVGKETVRVVVPGSWLHASDRAFPVRIDPTLALQPDSVTLTGWVDENSDRLDGAINSGSLSDVGFGFDVRGFAQFNTSTVPDGATIDDVRLRVWLSNHDNPLDPAVPLPMEIKAVASRVTVDNATLHAAIPPLFTGRTYTSEVVARTGPEFCPDSYVFREYDLGALADTDLEGQLLQNFFTVGFVSGIVTDPGFDHFDYIGYDEFVANFFGCAFTDFPGTRITLLVTYEEGNDPPVCDAGGPYVSDCPRDPITLDGTGSSDPDGDAITFAWTTDCPGTLTGSDTATPVLQLDESCAATCNVSLTVSDGSLSSSCSSTVTAADVTPPVVESSRLEGLCLWPPRHDMYCLGDPALLIAARDSCQPDVLYKYIGCQSDQPDEAREDGRPENGDGHFDDDCQVSADGLQLCVRVERAGSDPVNGRNTFVGRHYGVAVAADDGCGNVVIVTGTVNVPHDRRGGSGGQDDPCESGNGR